MSGIRRLIIVAVALATAAVATVILTYAGERSQGPLASLIARVGLSVSGAESAIVSRVRGNGRAAGLSWLEPYQRDVALLRDPPALLLGAYDDGMPATLQGAVDLERSLDTTFPLLHFYTAWGDRPEQQFPERMVRAIRSLGSVPVITWEPWLVDFDARLHPHLPPPDARERPGLIAIASGDYDFYIDRWAAAAAAYRQPLFVRFGHEMNDPYRYPWGPQDREPAEFIGAWRHVVERFRAAGADNVIWIWSPHIAYAGYWQFYPGDDVVDWIATGVLNYGNVAYWSRWWTFDEIFGRNYAELAATGKPIMIAELGTLAAGGDRAEWLRAALTDLPPRMPRVRAVLFFHAASDATVTYQTLDWTIARDSVLAGVVRDAMAPWVPARPQAR
jgi:hypothetical protein